MKIITYSQSTGFVDVELEEEWDGHIENCELEKAGFEPGRCHGNLDFYCFSVHRRAKDAPHDWHAIVEVCGSGFDYVLVKGPADLLALQLILAPLALLGEVKAGVAARHESGRGRIPPQQASVSDEELDRIIEMATGRTGT